jgi:hypothetical protein
MMEATISPAVPAAESLTTVLSGPWPNRQITMPLDPSAPSREPPVGSRAEGDYHLPRTGPLSSLWPGGARLEALDLALPSGCSGKRGAFEGIAPSPATFMALERRNDAERRPGRSEMSAGRMAGLHRGRSISRSPALRFLCDGRGVTAVAGRAHLILGAVALRLRFPAAPITSAARFSPLGPLGILLRLVLFLEGNRTVAHSPHPHSEPYGLLLRQSQRRTR